MGYEIGQRVGDYEIVQLLGVGGMGSVYRVRNVISDRTEAMKVLLPDLTAERDLAIRFIAEIRTLAGFDHPNIALLHTAFQADNQLIMMMEFVEGLTLEQRAKQGPMGIADVCGYTYQALSALSYAHGRGVVHRDIKPANLMLTSHGIVKLMDFGIAKSNVDTHLTRPGTTIGSLYYMSPEQVRGDAVDARSDLYSVGIMLYELLAGRRPFEADTTFSILNQQLNALPQPPIEVNPALPQALSDVIVHALAKDPAQRYQSADAFREALRPFCANQAQVPGHIAVPSASAATPAAASGVAAAALTMVESATAGARAARTAAVDAPPPPPLPPFADVVGAHGTAPAEPAPFVGTPSMHPPASSYPPASMYPPASPKKGSKALWIGTGIAAAVLAMVALAIGLPRVIGTHAAESGDKAALTQPADAPPASAPTTVTGTGVVHDGTPEGRAVRPEAKVSTGMAQVATPAATGPGASGSPKRPPYTGAGAGSSTGLAPAQRVEMAAPSMAATPAATSSGNAAELEQAQDRFTDVSARAGAVNSSISRLRREQEAQGLGLRGDMESADNRMESSLRAADQDLRAGNAASAAKNLTRAESDLATLEKFLGR
jgi:hypothetical protein